MTTNEQERGMGGGGEKSAHELVRSGIVDSDVVIEYHQQEKRYADDVGENC